EVRKLRVGTDRDLVGRGGLGAIEAGGVSDGRHCEQERGSRCERTAGWDCDHGKLSEDGCRTIASVAAVRKRRDADRGPPPLAPRGARAYQRNSRGGIGPPSQQEERLMLAIVRIRAGEGIAL